MAKSLQEQLMGAGLVDKKKAKDIQKEKRKQRKQTPKGKVETDEQKERIEQQRLEKIEKDKQLNRERLAEQEKRAIYAQIKQLVKMNEIKRSEQDEETFQFAVNNKIKKIYVSKENWNFLSKGKFCIAMLEEQFFVIPLVVADKISERDLSVIVYRYSGEVEAIAEDDPYKDYQIPDDLMW